MDQFDALPILEHRHLGHTTVLGGAYFDDNDQTIILRDMDNQSKEIYLVRQSNNERIHWGKTVFRIGKEPEVVDYCLDNSSVSRVHAEFGQGKDYFYVKDLDSSNGTYVNFKKFRQIRK